MTDGVAHCFDNTYSGKRVLVTGHTGFKGAWLTEWLLHLGADVTGFSLPPPTKPSLFEKLSLAERIRHIEGDVRDIPAVQRVVAETKPNFIFHLAAQPLVRMSYVQPVDTYSTNVMGTVHVLDALRQLDERGKLALDEDQRCVAVMITTDKCYENREWVHSYREDDSLGGYDPYSSSKAASEIVIAAYRRSFFSNAGSKVRVASARAGNVIGGGDWATDRIVPDCIRALQRGEVIRVRNKMATRPWQHVLEPLSGYLWLAACLARPELTRSRYDSSALVTQLSGPFNFGPALTSNRTVADVVLEVLKHWPGQWVDCSDSKASHEAMRLNLATDKAHHLLGWRPLWSFDQALARTMTWYREAGYDCTDPQGLTLKQICDYIGTAKVQGLAWAKV